jgi:hypothetical protein
MRSSRTLRRLAIPAILAMAFLFQGTWALAGVTGGIAGYVHDDTGAPVAGATVTATSPSQTAHGTTDASGHFQFLTLAPDTYTIRVEKSGYQTIAQAGLTVFADQVQQIALVAPRALKIIATQHTTAAALVKPGVGGDLYNITPAQQQASAALGGGGNLNNAYSAISAVPGIMTPTGGAGWEQMVVIHGENPYTTGYEYDGVPINRAFDQYISTNFTNLGLQELQVYTGGGPVSISSSGISGFINQVIKTGTYPGYASLQGGIGGPTFYHEAEFEAGGSTPDRNFSYYVGLSGYDQAWRSIDNSNGASYYAPGGELQYDGYNNIFQFVASSDYGYGDTAQCSNFLGVGLSQNPASYDIGCLMFDGADPGLYITDREDVVNLHFGVPRRDGQRDDFQLLWSAASLKSYFGANGSSPNDQLGYSHMTLFASEFPYNPNPNSSATWATLTGLPATSCAPYCANYPYYNDSTMYNLPFGTVVNPGTGVVGSPYMTYYFPDSPANRAFGAQLPANVGDNSYNDNGILKLQWTHPFSSSAYMRIYGYSMYTDWNQVGPNSAYEYDLGPFVPLADDYILTTHTVGGEIQLADQINDQNLLQLTGNYVTAGTDRWYNTGFVSGAFCSPLFASLDGTTPQGCTSPSEVGLISESGGRFTCWSTTSMTSTPCHSTIDIGGGDYVDTPYDNATAGEPAISGAALAAGAHYETIWNNNASASFNSVTPQFYNINLSEEWRPTDKLVVDVAGRYDNYDYLMPSTQNVQNEFYAQIIQDLACINPATDTPKLTPLTPGSPPPPVLAYYSTCPTGYVHPDGIGGHPLFSDVSPPHYDINYWSARFAATYNSDPNTVWRVSAGRFIEPPLTASVQYQNASGNNLGQWGEFMQFGFLSPFHATPAESSAQYDLSWEHHFANSGVSMKITPFYHYASNWQQQYFIGSGYVTQIPVGDFRSYGVEAQLQWGDFAANGFSGLISFAYTNAAVKYQNLLGESAVNQLNTAIEAYDCLTGSYYKANTGLCNRVSPVLASLGGAQPCYNLQTGVNGACTGTPSTGATGSCAKGTDSNPANCEVANPYYNATPQPLMDPNGWWPDPAATGSGLFLGPAYNDASGFAVPYTTALILNYRMNKFAITPSLQFDSGSSYGSAMDIPGVDPTACAQNQGATFSPVTANSVYACDYTHYLGGGISPYGTLFVPNPETGTFAHYGQYTEPSIVLANLQLTYDVSPKVRLTLTAANLYWTCFGGSSEPWTKAEPAGHVICGYDVNSLDFIGGPNGSGAYVGATPYDKANGITPPSWETQPYYGQAFTPGSGNSYFPLNIFLQAQIHV